jgi:peptidoglycan hydrolase CwlO-like protein
MLKRMVVSSVATVLLAGFVFGKDMFSYATTACSKVRDAVKSEITPEFEVDRIRHEIERLMPEIREHMTVVAEQSVDVKDLERTLVEREQKLARQKDAILSLRSDLASEQERFVYRHVTYTRGEVEEDLARRFGSFQVGEEALDRDRRILDAQRQTLRANQKKLDSMLGRKQDLSVQVASLEARLKTIQATEAVNSIELDETRLTHVEKMIQDLNRTLDVRESLLETQSSVLGRIPVEEASEGPEIDVLTEVDRHFGLKSTETGTEVARADSL